jgi:hypothetical protein
MIHEEEKEYTHPSYGMIGLSRCSGRARQDGNTLWDGLHDLRISSFPGYGQVEP